MPEKPEYRKHEIQLEHYIVSTGLAEMIRGSAIAPHVDGIWGCEFIENPLQPGFLKQKEFELSAEAEIAQIGMMIDNTTKTRALFEINKGTNKNPALDVNAKIPPEDRRIPFQNMIYIADGPSDIPCFSVVKERGGKAYGVYNPDRLDEFEQNDALRHADRIDHYGQADYRDGSDTCNWLRLQIQEIADRIVAGPRGGGGAAGGAPAAASQFHARGRGSQAQGQASRSRRRFWNNRAAPRVRAPAPGATGALASRRILATPPSGFRPGC